ncbi:MAG: aminotransferase class I/II-fold pyridoxal phosphate-dependent enzyme [Hymenobacteraceae bacterium]|nr:aminotransferase class I/II-fold pyridoxal phosphate-dependent enzyme [Hymenobacteraceae bacterium]
MAEFPASLSTRLTARAEKGLLRRLPAPAPGFVDFASNDYLGLVRTGRLAAAVQRKLLVEPALFVPGATGSRLLTGNSDQVETLETRLAAYHRAEAALIFSTGYAANAGFFGSVPQRGDTVLYDEAIHASVRDGLRLSLAKSYSFRHNDVADLESKLRFGCGTVYVAVESLYSMDGDLAPLPELASVCERHGLFLVVDEAHTTGVSGPDGAGRVVELGLEDAVFARLLTFGKAVGAAGAAWMGPAALRQYLINFARAFIYSTALPPLVLTTLDAAYDLLPSLAPERAQLRAVSAALATALAAVPGLRTHGTTSHIVHAAIPTDQTRLAALAATVRAAGFDVRPILPPTVPVGTARLRIIGHAHNSAVECAALAGALARAADA